MDQFLLLSLREADPGLVSGPEKMVGPEYLRGFVPTSRHTRIDVEAGD